MTMTFGPKIIEVGAVSIRQNTSEDNLDYDITDYHGNRYSVADEAELRDIRTAINEVLDDE